MNTRLLLKKHEGVMNKPYICPAGFKTIGVGYNMQVHPLPRDIQAYLDEHGQITDEHIERLLDLSITWAEHDCKKLFPDFEKFTHNRQMALIDFVFQLGLLRTMGFIKAVEAINKGQWKVAKQEMLDSKWAKQCPNRAEEITNMIEAG